MLRFKYALSSLFEDLILFVVRVIYIVGLFWSRKGINSYIVWW